MNALATMTPPTSPMTPAADPIGPVVIGGKITACRAALGASPVHPFVLARHAFHEAVGEITGGSVQAVVHLAQEVRQRRPISAHESVALVLDVLGARRDPRGVRLALTSTLVDADGGSVADLVTSLLLVGATAPEPFGTLPSPTGWAGDTRWATVVRVDVPADLPRRYAEISGDRNPIHLDRDAAEAAGFPDVIAHGMSVLALTCEEVVDRCVGGDAALVTGVGCRFSCPVVPSEPLEIALSPDGDRRARFTCRTPRGTALKNGWVEWVTS